MFYTPNGTVMFTDIPDMFYDLFTEIGLGINGDSYLYDQDSGVPILFKEKYIKASVNGSPIYAGRNDIVFDPANNYGLISHLFGYFLDKAQNSEDGDTLGGYIAHYIDDDPTKEKQRVVVKTLSRGEIGSMFYYNIYLAYIDCIFRISGYNVDLSNFDIKEEGK